MKKVIKFVTRAIDEVAFSGVFHAMKKDDPENNSPAGKLNSDQKQRAIIQTFIAIGLLFEAFGINVPVLHTIIEILVGAQGSAAV